jgi:hypothetical protein
VAQVVVLLLHLLVFVVVVVAARFCKVMLRFRGAGGSRSGVCFYIHGVGIYVNRHTTRSAHKELTLAIS